MSLIMIRWQEGVPDDAKIKIREEICQNVGKDLGAAPEYIAVVFDDHPPVDVTHHGAFVLMYLTEGRSEKCKDDLVTHITEGICRYSRYTPDKVNIMMVDIQKGSMATNGKIVNRQGAYADILNAEKQEQGEL